MHIKSEDRFLKQIALGCALLSILFFFTGGLTKGAESAKKGGADRQELFLKMIDLVVENNPKLKLQQGVIEEIEKMPLPGADFINPEDFMEVKTASGKNRDFSLNMAQVEQIRGWLISRRNSIVGAKQTYVDMKNGLVSGLLSSVSQILSLKESEKNSKELKAFLDERLIALENQIKVGMARPETLFDLKERTMSVELSIRNISNQLEIAKFETATNMGGTKWRELLDLLNKLE